MKKVLLISCVLIIGLFAQAQEWFPVGAEWTYQIHFPGGGYPNECYGVTSIKCVKDTVIEESSASVISGFSGCNFFDKEQIFYYNPTEDVVYMFINDEFKPYFDFSKNTGESYYMYFPNVDNQILELPYDSLEVRIDSIANKIIDGKDFRVQYINSYSKQQYHFFRGPIIEYIGGVNGFYPESGSCDHEVFWGLHCYSDEFFSYYTKPIYQEKGCDYIPLNIYKQSHKFTIYPNPANDFITLDSDEELAKIEIYNILGKCVLSQENCKNNRIDINTLQSGVYYIKATLITGQILTHKFIKL